jgi:hypothetical protein
MALPSTSKRARPRATTCTSVLDLVVEDEQQLAGIRGD